MSDDNKQYVRNESRSFFWFGYFSDRSQGRLYRDADIERIADSGRCLRIEAKGGESRQGKVVITESPPPCAALERAARLNGSYWLVVYDDAGDGRRHVARPPNVIGLRKLIGPEATDDIQPCNNEQFSAALADWERKNSKSNAACVGSAFAWQALDLVKESLKYNTGTADEPLRQLYELLHRKYGERH